MKKILLVFVLIPISQIIISQEIDYNIQKGYAVEGYDVTSYFSGTSEKGNKNFSYEYNGLKYLFNNEENLNKFKTEPEKYIPQYGGWCAYAMGDSGEKVKINPETFEIREGKLYLFYNELFTNTLQMWLDEGAEELKRKADENWKEIKYKKEK